MKLENLKIIDKRQFEVKGNKPFTGYALKALDLNEDGSIFNSYDLLVSKTGYNTLLVGDFITIENFDVKPKPFTSKDGVLVENHYEVRKIKNILITKRFTETITMA